MMNGRAKSELARSTPSRQCLKRGLAIHLQLLSSSQRPCDLRRLERCNEGACYGIVDLHATDVEAIAAAPLDEMLSEHLKAQAPSPFASCH
jgi:hypothetical protein